MKRITMKINLNTGVLHRFVYHPHVNQYAYRAPGSSVAEMIPEEHLSYRISTLHLQGLDVYVSTGEGQTFVCEPSMRRLQEQKKVEKWSSLFGEGEAAPMMRPKRTAADLF